MFKLNKYSIYLKTYFYAPHEIKFIKLNLRESFNHVDRMILCEFNKNHLGMDRDFIFHRYSNYFSQDELNKIIYLKCDLSNLVVKAKNSEQIHQNENLMRGYFESQMELNKKDIIISVDADEIIFDQYYDQLIDHISIFKPAFRLQLNQFFYKINYLWENENFVAPTIARVSYYHGKFPGQWRYDGDLYPEIVGDHFSWCMTIEEMLEKMRVYGHHYDYQHLIKKETMEEAIKNKTYPFDKNRVFKICELDFENRKEFYPSSIYSMVDEFQELIG